VVGSYAKLAGPGIGGGATFGFYAGVLYSFPMFYAMHLLFNGYTSELAWINTVYQIIVYMIVGATAGALNKARPLAPQLGDGTARSQLSRLEGINEPTSRRSPRMLR